MSAGDPLSDTVSRARNWRVASASVRGTSHIKTGKPCQDSVYHCVDLSDGVLIAAVSDGAGSARLSDIGSSLAVQRAVESARLSMLHSSARLSEGYLRDTVRASVLLARSSLEDEARRIGANVRDLSATLMLTICARGVLAAAQIGDGAVVAGDESGEYRLFTTPQRGEYANETVFLVSRNALSSLEVKAEPVQAARIAMFTDGIQNLVLDAATDTPHVPFFAPMFRWLESRPAEADSGPDLERFLTSPKVTQRTDDDVTLLLASLSETVWTCP